MTTEELNKKLDACVSEFKEDVIKQAFAIIAVSSARFTSGEISREQREDAFDRAYVLVADLLASQKAEMREKIEQIKWNHAIARNMTPNRKYMEALDDAIKAIE